jgi:hypothetical protein
MQLKINKNHSKPNVIVKVHHIHFKAKKHLKASILHNIQTTTKSTKELEKKTLKSCHLKNLYFFISQNKKNNLLKIQNKQALFVISKIQQNTKHILLFFFFFFGCLGKASKFQMSNNIRFYNEI